jgi:hypothetical protein
MTYLYANCHLYANCPHWHAVRKVETIRRTYGGLPLLVTPCGHVLIGETVQNDHLYTIPGTDTLYRCDNYPCAGTGYP